MRPLVPIAQQHEEQPLAGLGRQARARHHVLQPLLVAHIASVEAEDGILRQAEPFAHGHTLLRWARRRLRDVRPVPHPMDAAGLDSQRLDIRPEPFRDDPDGASAAQGPSFGRAHSARDLSAATHAALLRGRAHQVLQNQAVRHPEAPCRQARE